MESLSPIQTIEEKEKNPMERGRSEVRVDDKKGPKVYRHYDVLRGEVILKHI